MQLVPVIITTARNTSEVLADLLALGVSAVFEKPFDLDALLTAFPGGIPSHVAPETLGSIHEGGELGYSVAHAYGAVFDNPA